MNVVRAEVVLLALVVLIVGVILYDDGGDSAAFDKVTTPQRKYVNLDGSSMSYEYFEVKGLKLEGCLYRPRDTFLDPPIVIMAHGLGGQKEFQLDKYARKFLERGIAVLTFDYRFHGGSEGVPRHTSTVSNRNEDWNAAIKFVGTLSGINGKRIGLWGMSLAGGQVISLAASHGANKNKNITAIVAQAPFADGIDAGMRRPLGANTLRAVAIALKDLVLSFFGGSHYVKLGGAPGELCLMELTPEENKNFHDGLGKTQAHGWKNKVPARAVLDLITYRPTNHADQIKIPVLITYASRDDAVSAESVEAMVKKIEKVTVVKRNTTHFGILLGKEFDEVSTIQADFFEKHLK